LCFLLISLLEVINMADGTGDGSIKSARDLALRIATDPVLANEIKDNPAAAIARVAAPTVLQSDKVVYRMVVAALGITVLCAIIGALVVAAIGKSNMPESVVALGSTALGALAGLLAPSPRQS
jgi:hypothetical protein